MRSREDGWSRRLARWLGRAEQVAGARDPAALVDGPARLHELDGIRGWASLAVVVFHLYYETFGALFPAFRNPLTHALNGTFAVHVFFVLSGEALSAPFFAGGGLRSVASLAVKRHSRLSIPILASVLLVVLLQRAQLVYAGAAAPLVLRPDWLGRFATAPIGLGDAVRYGLLLVYTTTDSNRHLVPFLWTMSAEMTGSIFVFAWLGVWDALRRQTWLLGGAMLLLVTSWGTAAFACFAGGLLFGAWRRDGRFARVRARPAGRALALAGIVLAFVAVDLVAIEEARVTAAAALLLVGAIHCSPGATRFCRAGLSRLLGRLSFPLYLVHFAVIVSLTSWAIVRVAAAGRLDERAALAIGAGSVALALAAAAAFEPVEIVTKRVGHRLAAAFVAPRPAVAVARGAS